MYKISMAILGLCFTAVFAVMVLPPLWASGDVIGAFAAGFVNPYAAGYALDAIFCWLVLAAWVIHEKRSLGIRHGWTTLVVGVMPGVAAGFALYLLLRMHQLSEKRFA